MRGQTAASLGLSYFHFVLLLYWRFDLFLTLIYILTHVIRAYISYPVIIILLFMHLRTADHPHSLLILLGRLPVSLSLANSLFVWLI